MKLKSLYLLILLTAVASSSACWRNEVRADRNKRSTDITPSSSATPGPDSKTPSTDNKNNPSSSPKTTDISSKKEGFHANLPGNFQMPSDEVGLKLLREYGSICIAKGGATAPNKIFFRDEAETSSFQTSLSKSTENIGGFNLELQTAAMDALKKAIAEARNIGADITPRAADSAKRTYTETVKLWESRVTPGLSHWVSKGKLTQSEANRIKSLAPSEQVPEILRLESEGVYFSKDFSKSILYSVAAPGASQHIFMLALDIEQFANPQVRKILAGHGWFQTVQSDLPHFTYLGVQESELASKGLKPVTVSGQKFWVPNL